MLSTTLLYSCDPFLYLPDPYLVADSRQKENVYYAPPCQNVPLLSEKNDLSGSLSFGSTSKQSGVDVHSAFMPAKNFGLLGSYRSYKQKSNSVEGKISSYEFGAGYIKDDKKLHLEVYGGIGGGQITNTHHSGLSTVKFNNFFIQPTIAVQNLEKTVQFAFVSRFSSLHFKVGDTTYKNAREPFVTSQLKLINDNPGRIFWEPGVVLRAGAKNVLLEIAFSVTDDLSKGSFAMDKTNISFGLIFKGNVGNNNSKAK